jgi:hypothetical protein
MIMGIEISIQTGLSTATANASGSGREQHVISDTEVKSFGIQDKSLKTAVGQYFGKTPNDAYLKSPATGNDLYSTYGWPQVQTVLLVDSVTITGITSEPVIVAQQTFKNNSAVAATFNVGISQSVANTASSTWSRTDTLTCAQKITYKVGFAGIGGGGETSFTYAESWGESKTESQTVTVGTTSGVSVPLSPGQSVVSVLTASRGVMKVRVVYRAHLIGDTATNYNPKYKDHHFWAFGIGRVMDAGGIKNVQTVTEDLEIGFYANSQVELRDPSTGATLTTFNLLGRPGANSMEEVAALTV